MLMRMAGCGCMWSRQTGMAAKSAFDLFSGSVSASSDPLAERALRLVGHTVTLEILPDQLPYDLRWR